MSGDFDTKTPMEQAERIVAGASNARHLVMRNAGHDDVLAGYPSVIAQLVSFFAGEAGKATSEIVLEPIRFQLPRQHP